MREGEHEAPRQVVHIRYATDGDVDFFFDLRNEPVAAFMSCRGPVPFAEHVLWWNTTDDIRLVAIVGDVRMGTLRVSTQGVVSIIVHPDYRGQGYGTQMLNELSRIMKDYEHRTELYCEIRYENDPSQQAFLRAGWKPLVLKKML